MTARLISRKTFSSRLLMAIIKSCLRSWKSLSIPADSLQLFRVYQQRKAGRWRVGKYFCQAWIPRRRSDNPSRARRYARCQAGSGQNVPSKRANLNYIVFTVVNGYGDERTYDFELVAEDKASSFTIRSRVRSRWLTWSSKMTKWRSVLRCLQIEQDFSLLKNKRWRFKTKNGSLKGLVFYVLRVPGMRWSIKICT